MMRLTAVIALVVALGATHATAQENKAVLMGVGTTTCAQYADEYRRNPTGADPVFFSWAQGFMSGLNMTQMALKRPTHDLGAWTLLDQQARLRELCEKTPLLPYAYAVEDLMKAFPEVPPK